MNNKFNEWLSGLIDGGGCFLLSQKGYGSLEITMSINDSLCLYQIKKKYGGSIKLRSGSKSLRYRLHHKNGLLLLLNDVNGLIRHSIRLIQYNRLCYHYNIIVLDMKPLFFENCWMAGFFDADGTISINNLNYQLSISISQKTQELLLIIQNLYGGFINIDRSSNTYKLYITKQETILYLVENYFKKSYIYSYKRKRLFLIEEYYSLINLKNNDNIFFEIIWNNFYKKWIS